MGQRTFILLKKNYKNNNGEWTSKVSLIHHQWGIGRVMQGLLLQEVLKTQFNMDRSMSYINSDTEPMPNDDGYLTQPISMFYTFSPLNSPKNNYSFRGNEWKALGLKELKLFNEAEPRTVKFYGADNKTLQEEDTEEPTTLFEYPMEYNYDIFDIENIGEFYNLTDNNNGGMVVEVTQQYRNDGSCETIISQAFKVKVGFCTGGEEENFYHESIGQCYDRVVYNPAISTIVSPNFYSMHTFNNDKAMKDFSKSFVTICKQADVKFVYDKEKENKLLELEKTLVEVCNSLAKKGKSADEIVKECNNIIKGRNLCFA